MICTIKAYFVTGKVSEGLFLLPQSLFNTRIESIETPKHLKGFSALLMFLGPQKFILSGHNINISSTEQDLQINLQFLLYLQIALQFFFFPYLIALHSIAFSLTNLLSKMEENKLHIQSIWVNVSQIHQQDCCI